MVYSVEITSKLYISLNDFYNILFIVKYVNDCRRKLFDILYFNFFPFPLHQKYLLSQVLISEKSYTPADRRDGVNLKIERRQIGQIGDSAMFTLWFMSHIRLNYL